MSELSVILSAGERPQDVVAALERLAVQTVAPADVIVAAPRASAELERIVSTPRGLHARFVAREELGALVPQARGELVAFLDAALLPDLGWVAAVRAGSERYHEASALFGPVALAFDGAQPEWLAGDAELFLRWLGRFELGAADCELDGGEAVVDLPASNVVVRRAAIHALGLHAVPASEAARVLVARHWAAGAACRYLGRARVVRRVPREQSVPRWFVLRAFDEGRASAAGLAALRDVLPAGALAAFAAMKGDELASTLRRLELMGVSFSRLPLRWRAELGELMGLVAGVQAQAQVDDDYRARLAHVDPKILDGDAPEAFLSWLDDVSRSARGGSRASVGAA